jgi:hypothetical protein
MLSINDPYSSATSSQKSDAKKFINKKLKLRIKTNKIMFGLNTKRKILLLEKENEILSDRLEQITKHLKINLRPNFYEISSFIGLESYDQLRRKYRSTSVDKL